jgi:hypothetical protein
MLLSLIRDELSNRTKNKTRTGKTAPGSFLYFDYFHYKFSWAEYLMASIMVTMISTASRIKNSITPVL